MTASNRVTPYLPLSWLKNGEVLIVAAMLGIVCVAVLSARNSEMMARELVAEAEALVMRSDYLQHRQCVVADVAGGEAIGYRCNKPTADQYVSVERVNAVLQAKYAYLTGNNCERAAGGADTMPTYRCAQSAPVVWVSEATVLEFAEKSSQMTP